LIDVIANYFLNLFLINVFSFVSKCRDGRLREGDQILAIDGQVLEAAISHQAAIGILQRARGLVDLVVARGLNPLADVPVPLIPAFNLPQVSSTPQAATAAVLTTATSQQHSPDSSHSRHPSSSHSHSGSSLSASPEPSISAVVGGSSANFLATTATTLTAAAVGRSPSALSDTSKTGSDMVVSISGHFTYTCSYSCSFSCTWPLSTLSIGPFYCTYLDHFQDEIDVLQVRIAVAPLATSV
jgi:hypothetical protein